MNSIISEGMEKIRLKGAKDTALSDLLSIYYDVYIQSSESIQGKSNISVEPCYPVELTVPSWQRECGIHEALNELAEMGVDFNEGNSFEPLMLAVAFCDASVTEYLIQHGANPNDWIEKAEMERLGVEDRNYYYEELDIAVLNEAWNIEDANFINAVMSTAKVLATVGSAGSFSGYCLSVDAEKREIKVDSPAYKF